MVPRSWLLSLLFGRSICMLLYMTTGQGRIFERTFFGSTPFGQDSPSSSQPVAASRGEAKAMHYSPHLPLLLLGSRSPYHGQPYPCHGSLHCHLRTTMRMSLYGHFPHLQEEGHWGTIEAPCMQDDGHAYVCLPGSDPMMSRLYCEGIDGEEEGSLGA